MGKSELALLYFPGSNTDSALKHLMRWVCRCPPLVAALADTGYRPRQKEFTSRQVELIYLHLGEPG